MPAAVATAVSEYEPVAMLLETDVNGATVAEPSKVVVLAKNCTLVTGPAPGEVLAPSLRFAGAAKTAAFAGFVKLTVGGVLAVTEKLTGVEVARIPDAVATAVRE